MKRMTIDIALLYEQIKVCETKTDNASDDYECNLFLGIENLLSDIADATENEDIVQFINITKEKKD